MSDEIDPQDVLERAVESNCSIDDIENLIELGADVHANDGFILGLAVLNNSLELIKYFVEKHEVKIKESNLYLSQLYNYDEQFKYLQRAMLIQIRNRRIKEHLE